MAVETTYTNLRDRLASVLDQVADNQEVVIVRRRGAKDVALIPAEELAGLMETAHLLRSPKNARRLLTALERAKHGGGKPQSLENCTGRWDLSRPAEREALFQVEFRENLTVLGQDRPQDSPPHSGTGRSGDERSLHGHRQARAFEVRAGRLLVAPNHPRTPAGIPGQRQSHRFPSGPLPLLRVRRLPATCSRSWLTCNSRKESVPAVTSPEFPEHPFERITGRCDCGKIT
jgi:antitoxin YefM